MTASLRTIGTKAATWSQIVTAMGGAGVWREEFGRRFLHGRVDPDALREGLGWSVVDDIMQTSTIEPLMIRLSATPMAYPGTYIQTRIDGGDIVHRTWRYGAMTEYLRSGATLVTNRADRLHPGPARLREEFEYFADDPAWVNCYACWTTDSAFGRHKDGHPTVIVQTEGSKHWRVWNGTGPDAEPVADRVMEAGDIWHIPREWDHEATGVGPSLHWTFGVHVSTPADLVASVLESVRNGQTNAGPLPDPIDDARAIAEKLAARVGNARAIRSAQSLERRGGLSLPWSIVGGPYAGTRLRWAARFPPLVERTDAGWVIESLGTRLTIDPGLDPWAREWVAGRSVLRDDSAELARSEAEIDAALDTLVRAGLLLVERASTVQS